MASPARSRPEAAPRSSVVAAGEGERPHLPTASAAFAESAAPAAHRTPDTAAILTGVLSAGMGMVALAGPLSMGMALAAALNFVLLGLGFVAMGLRWRAAALWIAVVVGLSNLVLFAGHPAYGEPGLDARALSRWWPDAPVSTYAMNPNAALGCFLVAVAVFLLANGRKLRGRLTATGLLGSAVAALGIYGAAGRLTGLQSTYGVGQLTGMAFPVACGLVVLSVGVLAESWRQGRHLPAERQSWILVMVAMTGIVTSTSLWRALLLVESLHFESARQLRSYSAGAVLLLGLLATGLLGAAIYLVQTARQRVSVAERLRGDAENEATQRKLAEQSLARANAYNRSLIEASIDPLVTIGADGKITDVNAATEGVTGRSRQELIGADFCDYFTDPEKARAGYQQVFRDSRVHDYELEVCHRDGRITPVLYNASVYHDQAGAVIGVFAAARDITERKTTEQALLRSEARYRALVLASSQIVWSTPPDGLVKDIPAWREYTGQTVEQVRGWGWLDAIHPDDREPTAAIWEKTVESEGLYETEYRIRRADGQYRHFAIRGVPVLEDGGDIREWVGICTDIHDRKQVEDELRKQAALLSLAHDAIIVADLEYRIIFWSRGAEETYGWSAKEAVGRVAPELLHTEFSLPLPEIRAAVQQQEQWEGELKHRTRDGMTIVVASRWSLQRDHHGNPTNVLEINRDITERRRLEEELQARQAYTRSLIEASLDPLVTIAADGEITDVNRATEEVTGVSRAQLVGSDFSAYFTEPDKARAGYQQVFAEGLVQDYPLAIRHRSGRVTEVLYNASVFRKQTGEVAGVFAAARDVTERKRLEDSLRQRTLELENSVAELEAFSYSVSHDLRAPLRSIDGFSQILLEDYRDKVDAEGQDSLRRIRAASQNMAQLIDALLQLSRVMRAELSRETVELSILALSTAAMIQKADPRPHLRFGIAAGLQVRGDRRLLGIVLQNLLQNAWKFSARSSDPIIEFGSIRKDGQTAYYVRDNGIGFDMTYANKLFTPFQRLHAKEQFEGTGIGLATVQRIIKRHGGKVWAEGAEGKGATFYFSLN